MFWSAVTFYVHLLDPALAEQRGSQPPPPQMMAVVMQPLQTLPVLPLRILAKYATEGSHEVMKSCVPNPCDVISRAETLQA